MKLWELGEFGLIVSVGFGVQDFGKFYGQYNYQNLIGTCPVRENRD